MVESAAGWPEVRVSLKGGGEDANAAGAEHVVMVWSGAVMANDAKHSLQFLVDTRMKERRALVALPGTTRVSTPGFFGWGAADKTGGALRRRKLRSRNSSIRNGSYSAAATEPQW